jgi:hypothetical protein
MTNQSAEATCANCGRPLDPNDKFCRECGLPTPRNPARPRVPVAPPDTAELKRAVNAVPDPQPFTRVEPEPELDAEPELEATEAAPPPAGARDTTGSAVRATSPTFAMQSASVAMVMLVVIVLMAIAGMILLAVAILGR